MRNSSICSAATNTRSPRPAFALPVLASLVALLLLPWPGVAAKGKKKAAIYEPTFLIQPFLSPEFAQWLIGPIARMASQQEIESYLGLQDDEAARRFIAEFWQRRNPRPGEPSNRLRETFEARATEVDGKFGEALYRGRHTDRGTIWILYGPPEETDFEVAPYPGGPAVEVWRYGKDVAAGLDEQKPERLYRFIREGDRTVFYNDAIRERNLRKPQARLPRPDQPPFR